MLYASILIRGVVPMKKRVQRVKNFFYILSHGETGDKRESVIQRREKINCVYVGEEIFIFVFS